MSIDSHDGRVVARFLDGRVLKGTTHDFGPQKTMFHLTPHGVAGAKPVEIDVSALKALFFVRSWDGDAKRVDRNTFEQAAGQGRRVVVTFRDGELLAGFTVGYAAGKRGFFVIPADRNSNNTRVFVVQGAVKKLDWVDASDTMFAAVKAGLAAGIDRGNPKQ